MLLPLHSVTKLKFAFVVILVSALIALSVFYNNGSAHSAQSMTFAGKSFGAKSYLIKYGSKESYDGNGQGKKLMGIDDGKAKIQWMPDLSAQEDLLRTTTEIDECIQDGRYICGSSDMGDTSTLKQNRTPAIFIKGDPKAVRLRFKQRSVLLAKQCGVPKHFSSTLKYRDRVRLGNFAFGRLKYCPIPKIGTTFTKFLQKRLFSGTKMKRQPPQMRRQYVFVREPYSRLMSGYIGKIMTNQQWWGTFGRIILSIARPNVEVALRCASNVTFPEFVKYLIFSQEQGRFLNTHFKPIHQQCGFCERQYDFIGHLETLSEDMAFMLDSVSIDDTDISFDDSEGTIYSKCKSTIRSRQKIVKCKDMCDHLQTVWWSFQARGLISQEIYLPITGRKCNTITVEEFAKIAIKAHKDSVAITNRSQQKRAMLANLFLQVPLDDRLRLRELYLADFELFGYDPSPPDLFPELQ